MVVVGGWGGAGLPVGTAVPPVISSPGQHSNTAANAVIELVALLGSGDDGRETLLQHRVSPTEGFGCGSGGESSLNPWWQQVLEISRYGNSLPRQQQLLPPLAQPPSPFQRL